MKELHYEDVSGQIGGLINSKSSFTVIGLKGKMSDVVDSIERVIEKKGLSCRIYTRGRVAAAGGSCQVPIGSFLGGLTGVIGVVSTIGIAAHNIATYDPDYEIAKHQIDNKLTITYMKK